MCSKCSSSQFLLIFFTALAYDSNQDKVLVVLGERKNKERFIATHPIKYNNRSYDLEEETAMYDKSNVLGKGIAKITAINDSIFTVSNLIRKLKVDMKPTTARVQIPNDCLDGVIDVSAMPSSGPKLKSKSQSNQVVLALKTKSLSGKGKYAIEWYR